MDEHLTPAILPSPRLLSLDIFRGLTIAMMVLVNNPGSWDHIYPPLEHASWWGCTPTDLVFPFFLFIVGVAIPFSQASRLRKLQDPRPTALVPTILRRSVMIYTLGWLLGAIPVWKNSGILSANYFHNFRIPGVLQRIAVCYLVVALIALLTKRRTQIAVAVGLLVVYTLLMFCVPVPGYGTRDFSRQGNVATYIDTHVLGRHIYIKPVAAKDAVPLHAFGRVGWIGPTPAEPGFDPEGILSTLPAITTTLLGLFAGQWLRGAATPSDKAAGLMFGGVGASVAGYVLAGAVMDLNKSLWTPSFAVYTAGLAMLGLGAIYWLVDVKGYRRFTKPLVILGMNAIAIFVISGMLSRLLSAIKWGSGESLTSLRGWYYRNLFLSLHLSPLNTSLLHAIVWVLLMLAITTVMHRRRWYLKV